MWTVKALLLANLIQADALQRKHHYYHRSFNRDPWKAKDEDVHIGHDQENEVGGNFMLSQKKVKDFPEYSVVNRKFFEERYDASGNLIYKKEFFPSEDKNHKKTDTGSKKNNLKKQKAKVDAKLDRIKE